MMTSCDNTAAPIVTVNPPSPARAAATPTASGLTVTITIGGGDGTGIVTASPIGPNYPPGTVVTLTAAADTGSCFGGWTASCETFGRKAICTVTIDASTKVGAEFDKACPTPTPTYCHSIVEVELEPWDKIDSITCPSGAKQFCDTVPIVATNSVQAKAACQTCNGWACGDAVAVGMGGHAWYGLVPGVPNAERGALFVYSSPPFVASCISPWTYALHPGDILDVSSCPSSPLSRWAR
jgi:hypothetical protein